MYSGDELYHFGRKGMKWGMHIFTNKDGSLNALGRKKYGTKANYDAVQRAKAKARTDAEIAKINAKSAKKISSFNDEKSKKKTETKPAQKSISEMSDAEIKAKLDRLELESRYKKKLSEMNPKTVSKGKQLADSLAYAVIGAVKEKGKKVIADYLEKEIKKALGVKEDEMSILKKQAEKLKYQKEILSNQKSIAVDADYLSKRDERQKVAEEAKKQVNDYNKKWTEKGPDKPSDYNMKGSKVVQDGPINPVRYPPSVRDSTPISVFSNGSKVTIDGREYVADILDRDGNKL